MQRGGQAEAHWHRRVAHDPFPGLMDVVAGGQVHGCVRTPDGAPLQLLHLLHHDMAAIELPCCTWYMKSMDAASSDSASAPWSHLFNGRADGRVADVGIHLDQEIAA